MIDGDIVKVMGDKKISPFENQIKFYSCLLYIATIKRNKQINQSHYGPGQAVRVPGV